jgi:hypothetical protein
MREEIETQIRSIEERLEFLKTDRTVWVSAWAGPKGYTPYNHGPYLRKLERNRLNAKLKTLRKKLNKI